MMKHYDKGHMQFMDGDTLKEHIKESRMVMYVLGQGDWDWDWSHSRPPAGQRRQATEVDMPPCYNIPRPPQWMQATRKGNVGIILIFGPPQPEADDPFERHHLYLPLRYEHVHELKFVFRKFRRTAQRPRRETQMYCDFLSTVTFLENRGQPSGPNQKSVVDERQVIQGLGAKGMVIGFKYDGWEMPTKMVVVYQDSGLHGRSIPQIEHTMSMKQGCLLFRAKFSMLFLRKENVKLARLLWQRGGSLITVVFCMSAGGSFIPPLIIFPCKLMSPLLMKGAPSGPISPCHPSGWIQTHLFTLWFRHFLQDVKPTKECPVLSILDGHNTHTRNIYFINLARENNVTILCLPPHANHKMQPLGKTLIGALKTYYSEDVRTSFGRPYLLVQPGTIEVNGFKDIFSDHDFLVSDERNEHAIATPEESQTDDTVVQQCAIENDLPSSRPNLKECVTPLPYSSCSNETSQQDTLTDDVSMPVRIQYESAKRMLSQKRKDVRRGRHQRKSTVSSGKGDKYLGTKIRSVCQMNVLLLLKNYLFTTIPVKLKWNTMEHIWIMMMQCLSSVKQSIQRIHKVKRGYSEPFASFGVIPSEPAMKVEHMFVTIDYGHRGIGDRIKYLPPCRIPYFPLCQSRHVYAMLVASGVPVVRLVDYSPCSTAMLVQELAARGAAFFRTQNTIWNGTGSNFRALGRQTNALAHLDITACVEQDFVRSGRTLKILKFSATGIAGSGTHSSLIMLTGLGTHATVYIVPRVIAKALMYATGVDDVDSLRNRIEAGCLTIRYFPGIHQLCMFAHRAGRCRWSAGFLEDIPFPPPLHSGAAPYSPRFTLIGSQVLAVNSRPNVFTLRFL
ncbi:hypothetical protein PR048_009296 [Dryococelus australis]|uniref:DDE-1 domain-containing protein n=1 Tax=Dryococelus australis TaxID=614101 RepID=A0ABQ9I1B7_9NEOP|nr:hypothetical protein PR048_009296 [Dryococelus australis]